jgi:hypothetical protein
VRLAAFACFVTGVALAVAAHGRFRESIRVNHEAIKMFSDSEQLARQARENYRRASSMYEQMNRIVQNDN